VASEYVSDIRYFLENSRQELNDVLVVGFGAGTLLKELDGADYHVDAVEINLEMIEVAEEYFGLADDLSFNVYISDGRTFLSQTEKKYDAIVMDICNVNEYNAHLWTEEFFALARTKLKDPETGVIIASRGVVHNPQTEKLDHMIANSVNSSFENMYYTQRVFEQDEYDVAVFMATNQAYDDFPSRNSNQPNPDSWKFDPSAGKTSDERLDEATHLFLPATESIIQQVRENFGQAILLPI
jgi:spermidine synthase